MQPVFDHHQLQTRRHFFGRSAVGIGTAALATLLNRESVADQLVSHFAPTAKRVIYLFQNGAPTQVDLFDHKPQLERFRGTDLPKEVQGGQRLTTMTQGRSQKILPSAWKFQRYGDCGTHISTLLPHTGSIADDICLVRSAHTEAINHAPAITLWLTGAEQPGRPSFGAWLSYGLGHESQELPTFCVMTSRDKEASCGQLFYEWYWGNGFLPSRHQGVKFRARTDRPAQ